MGKEVAVLDRLDASAETKQSIKVSLVPFFDDAHAMQKEAMGIVVTSVDETDKMQRAREMRLALVKIRTSADKERIAMKEESQRKGRAIDGMGNIIKDLTMTAEKHLKKQEDFVKIIEEELLDDLEVERNAILDGYEEGLSDMYKVREMDEEMFDLVVDKFKRAKQAQADAEKQAEADRKKKEKEEAEENERIRKENAKLQKEADERDKKEAAKQAERDKADAESKEKQRKIDEAHEAELEKERAEKKRLEDEIREKREAGEKAQREAEEKERKDREAKERADKEAALAPDKKKLEAFAIEIGNITFPEVNSKEAMAILKKANGMIHDVSAYIKEKSIEL